MSDWLVQKIVSRVRPARSKRWLRIFNDSTAERLNHKLGRAYFKQYMRGALGHFMLDIDEGPFPPKELLMRTFVLDEKDAEKKLNPDFYFSSGYWHLLWWLQTAERYGFKLRTTSAILDFGSGTARLIRHLRCVSDIRLVGTDLYSPNVEWCRREIPGVEFFKNDERPPLTFAEDASFDLVYAASVFTHIPLETQALWISEMLRIIRPGGFLVCDMLGRYHQEHMLNAGDLSKLRQEGRLTITQSDTKASLATKLIGSWDVFETRHEVLKAFRSQFEICDFIPAKIDTLILRKPEDRRWLGGTWDLGGSLPTTLARKSG